jgi:AraC-like DNA-binding protein
VSRCDGQGVNRGADRVLERRRAVALARHYQDFEGLSIRQIAGRLGRSPAKVKAYFYDPTGEKARAGEAPLRRGVPRLRGVHAAAERERGRLRVMQGLPSRRDRALLDAGGLDAMRAWRETPRLTPVLL